MRIFDGLIYQLKSKGFQKVNINIDGLLLFFHAEETQQNMVVLFHAPSGYELSEDEYPIIMESIREQFAAGGFTNIRLLSIIFTRAPERSRKYCLEQDDHWIVDMNERRLIIFENQATDFLDIMKELENLLENDRFTTDIYMDQAEKIETHHEKTHHENGRNDNWIRVTFFNTILIATNLIIYLLVYHTKILGDSEIVVAKGALSWVSIKEQGEYYRLLTAMFLHADFGHLINNMLILFFVGDNLERAAGKGKFLLIYFGSGIIAGITSFSYNMVTDTYALSIGASGALFGVVGAMVYILAVNKGHLEDISSRQIILFTIFSLYGGISSANIDNAAHIGGFIGGLILALLLYRKKKTS